MRIASAAFLAAALVAPAFAQTTETAAMIPAQANAAGFVNVGKILEEYGMLFDGGPLAEQIEQFVAMGMPDPREEGLSELAFASTIDGFDADKFIVTVSRDGSQGAQPELANRLAQFAEMTGMVQRSESAYRGVTLHELTQEDSEESIQIGDVSEYDLIASVSRSGDHGMGQLAIDTVKGENQSFAAKYGTTLGDDEYAAVSFEVPKKFRRELEDTQFAFLSLVAHARATLAQRDGMVRLDLDGVCMDDFDAEALKRALVKVFDRLREEYTGGDSEWDFILDNVQFSREGDTATVSLALPEDLVKDLLGGLTGNEGMVE